ncbi:hypothetical protein Tco_1075770, partial [Tanacetum coccineum]
SFSYLVQWYYEVTLPNPYSAVTHFGGVTVVVKERTTPTAITEGSWGFEHTKACFRDEIIPFVKALKDLFSTFNQHLVDELSEVQNVFYQMEQAVEQHRIESKTFEVKMNQVLNENERLLEQVMSKDIVNLLVNPSVENDSVNVHECQKCLKLETELQTDFVKRETYDKLFKSFTILEKHCISLEVDTQLKQEIFQRENSVSNQSVPSFDQLFELNELKAQSQEKDTVIKKLKERIKSLSGKMDKDKIKQDFEEIETINIELDHRVTKLIAENEHLKQTYKQLYDSIKPARLVPNPHPSTSFVPPSRTNWDMLFQLLFDEFLNPSPSVDHPAPEVVAPINEVIAPVPIDLTGSPSSTTIDQDAPSLSNSQTTPKTEPLVIPNDVEEDNHDIEVAHMGNDPYFGVPIPEIPSNQSSSSDSIHTIVHPDHQIFKHNSKYTKDHPLENIIGELARPVSTRLQLHE